MNLVARLWFTFLRYYFYFSFLYKHRFLRKSGRTRWLDFAPGKLIPALVISPEGPADPTGLVIHFHGMGDDIPSTFKDGILTYVENSGAILAVPDLGPESWCSESVSQNIYALIMALKKEYQGLPIILSGTSMGGCIALSALKSEKIEKEISGVIAVSASTRLDLLMESTSQATLKQALASSVDEGCDLKESLLELSFHQFAKTVTTPVIVLYSLHDPVIPRDPLLETFELIQKTGGSLTIKKMKRLKGHFRPIASELADAYSFLHKK